MSHLVNGNIPKGTACPFLAKCGLKTDNCPSTEKTNPQYDYSCGAARAWNMMGEDRAPALIPLLRKKS